MLQFERCLLKLDPLVLPGWAGVHCSFERCLTSERCRSCSVYMFEVVQVTERYLRSSLLVLCDELMSTHVDASFLFRRRIYHSMRRRVQKFRCWGLSRRTGDVARTAAYSQQQSFRADDVLVLCREPSPPLAPFTMLCLADPGWGPAQTNRAARPRMAATERRQSQLFGNTSAGSKLSNPQSCRNACISVSSILPSAVTIR